MKVTILRSLHLIILLSLSLTIFGCASTPKVFSNAAANVNFSDYKTYGFFAKLATDKENYESMDSKYLKASVSRQMEQRGFVKAENPDLEINFYIHTKEKIRSRTTPTMGGGYYDGWRDPYYDTWGGYGGSGYETRIDQYTEGTLNIDLVDTQKKTLVWEGSVSGRITEKVLKNLEAEIDKAVTDIFGAFPVQATGAQ
jgi:hypothetical protein